VNYDISALKFKYKNYTSELQYYSTRDGKNWKSTGIRMRICVSYNRDVGNILMFLISVEMKLSRYLSQKFSHNGD